MPFEDIEPRLKRAVFEHLNTLKGEVDSFLGDENKRVAHDFDSVPGQLLVKAEASGEPPPVIGLLIGEILYQLRAALNNLTCELAKLNGHQPDGSMEFPIFRAREAFGDRRNHGSRAYPRIHKLAEAHQAIIEAEQPFNVYRGDPDNDPLWLFYELSNSDRHKALHFTVVSIRSTTTVLDPPVAHLETIRSWAGPLDGETEIARYRVVNSGPAITVEVKTDTQWDMSFDPQLPQPFGGKRVLYTLGDIGMRVTEIVSKLTGTFATL